MSVIFKKCFLFHNDPTINSDKVFNVFLIDNQDGSFSVISEYGRNGTKLKVKPLIENCSLSVAQSHYSAKIDEKRYHKKTPYTQTLNSSGSPTFQKFNTETNEAAKSFETAKIIDFKSAQSGSNLVPNSEKESGGQTITETVERRSKQIGVLNLNQLDALEL